MSEADRPAIIAEIAAKRDRQVTQHGYDDEHDDYHDEGELAAAAACYAAPFLVYRRLDQADAVTFHDPWPFEGYEDGRAGCGTSGEGGEHDGANYITDPGEYTVAQRRGLLITAAAFIVAEVERLDRYARDLPRLDRDARRKACLCELRWCGSGERGARWVLDPDWDKSDDDEHPHNLRICITCFDALGLSGNNGRLPDSDTIEQTLRPFYRGQKND